MESKPVHNTVYGLYALILLFLAPELQAAPPIWQDLTEARARSAVSSFERRFRADDGALRSALAAAPRETSLERSQRIQLPLPDGRLVELVLIESSIMAPEIAARYPELGSYKVYGADDERLRGRLSISPGGLRGMLRTPEGRVFIDPENPGAQDNVYISQRRGNRPRTSFRCGVQDDQHRDLESWLGPKMRSASRVEGSLLRYDLAVAVTREYYDFQAAQGPSDPDTDTAAAINDTITRVNEIYESDLGITLRLVSGAELYETGNAGLDNANADALLPEVKDFIDSRIAGGSSAYDIGHMFSRPPFVGGGLAFLGGVCDDATKAGGVTGLPDPRGDPFDIDYVAHEIGHQFDAEHSFNGTTSSCRTGRWGPSAYEPGSGTTIMGYANLCGAEDLQDATAATFHAGSIAEIERFTQGAGNCYALRPTSPAGNADPVITSLPNENIPANTPFILGRAGIASDPDTAVMDLRYQWDQMDAGCPTDATTFGTDNGSNALFRSDLPRVEEWRNFPALRTQLNGLYDKAEVLPCQQRDLNFRLTARDGSSGQDTEDVRLRVDKNSGPFRVTSHSTPQVLISGNAFTVNWAVANTDREPVSCANVEIDLLVFTSNTYSSYSIHSLTGSTPNNGTASVTLNPNTATTPPGSVARLRVKCRNNVFYALSRADLTVDKSSPDPATPLANNEFITRGAKTAALTSTNLPACRAPVDCGLGKSASSSSKGSSTIDWLWLLLLVGAATFIKGLRSTPG